MHHIKKIIKKLFEKYSLNFLNLINKIIKIILEITKKKSGKNGPETSEIGINKFKKKNVLMKNLFKD